MEQEWLQMAQSGPSFEHRAASASENELISRADAPPPSLGR